MTRFEELSKQIEDLLEKRDQDLEKLHKDSPNHSFDDYRKTISPYIKLLKPLSMEKRFEQTPHFTELPDYGDHMTFEQFKAACDAGGFVDDDGSGFYATATNEADIPIYPSDFKYSFGEKWIRKDFTHVVWYNK